MLGENSFEKPGVLIPLPAGRPVPEQFTHQSASGATRTDRQSLTGPTAIANHPECQSQLARLAGQEVHQLTG